MKNNDKIRQRSGTSLLEYAVLIAVVITALVGVSIAVKRSVCGNWKQAADVFGYGRSAE